MDITKVGLTGLKDGKLVKHDIPGVAVLFVVSLRHSHDLLPDFIVTDGEDSWSTGNFLREVTEEGTFNGVSHTKITLTPKISSTVFLIDREKNEIREAIRKFAEDMA